MKWESRIPASCCFGVCVRVGVYLQPCMVPFKQTSVAAPCISAAERQFLRHLSPPSLYLSFSLSCRPLARPFTCVSCSTFLSQVNLALISRSLEPHVCERVVGGGERFIPTDKRTDTLCIAQSLSRTLIIPTSLMPALSWRNVR